MITNKALLDKEQNKLQILQRHSRLCKHYKKQVIGTDTLIEIHPMKKALHNVLKNSQNQNRLILKASKKNSIIDVISCVPQMITQAVTTNNIIHGLKKMA